MKLSSGEIYFIGEYDVKAGTRSEYFKIGIVRHGGKDNRTSLDRLLEHQTGNPRRLEIVHILEADAVEGIETSLHHMFAPHRVYGEWLRLDEKLINEVKLQAEQLKSDMAKYRSIFESAEGLQGLVSQEGKLTISDESEFWFEKYSKANLRFQECESVISEYKAILIKDIQDGKNRDEFISVQQKAPRLKFDVKSFKDTHPEIYKKFCTQNTRIRGAFRPSNASFKEVPLIEIDPLLASKIGLFREALQVVESSVKQSELHNQFLEIQSDLAFADWERELAIAHLKNLCGTAEGINGVCTWKRTEVVEDKLDERALKDNYADLYQQFTSIGEETKAYSLETRSAYIES